MTAEPHRQARRCAVLRIYNRILLTVIRFLMLVIAVIAVLFAAAIPLGVPGGHSILQAAVALLLVALQVRSMLLCGRELLEHYRRRWEDFDRDHAHLAISIMFARLEVLVRVPFEFFSAVCWFTWILWAGVVVALVIANPRLVPPDVTLVALALCPAVSVGIQWSRLNFRGAAPESETIRGRIRTRFEEAKQREAALSSAGTTKIPWGGVHLIVDRTLTHLTMVGNNRSGKTVNIRLIMQALLPAIGRNNDACARAIALDPKTNFLPYFAGLLPAERIRILHPFDQRSWAWDIAADIQTPTDANNVAVTMIPDGKRGNDNFFQAAARDMYASVMTAYHMTCPRAWNLRDVLLTFWTPERIESVLSRTPLTRNTLMRYGGNPRTLGDISATLRKELAGFEPIAACWQYAGNNKMSLTEWPNTNTLLVFGYSDTAKQQVNIINRCMFQRLSHVLLTNEAGADRGRTWLILDELKEAGELPGLSSVALRGAEAKVHLLLGFQSVLGMREVYGENVSGEVIGQCSNLAVFRLGNDRKTAEWAADMIGKAQLLERYQSRTEGRDSSQTTSESSHDRHLYMPEQLQTLPATNPQYGLQGVFVSEQYGVVDAGEADISGETLFGSSLRPPDDLTASFLPRPDSQHYLEDWDAEDLRRLKFADVTADALSQVSRF